MSAQRDLSDVEQPVLPAGYRFRTADETGPQAAVLSHVDAWAPSAYTAQSYADVQQTAAYRGDLHVLVEAPDGTMAASTIMWLDEANKTVEFEPVGALAGCAADQNQDRGLTTGRSAPQQGDDALHARKPFGT